MTLDNLAQLEGKRVIITGVSSGIGEQLMREAAERGAKIVGTYLHTRPADYAHDNVVQRRMDAGEVLPALVESNADLFLELLGGKPDIVVYNAGVFRATHHFSDARLSDRAREWKETLQTNFMGPYFLFEALLAKTGMDHHAVHAFTGSVARPVQQKFTERADYLPTPGKGCKGLAPYSVARTAAHDLAHSVNNEVAFLHGVDAPVQTRIALVEYQFVPSKVGDGVVVTLGVPNGEVAAQLTPHGRPVDANLAARLALSAIVDRYNLSPGAKMGDTLIPPVGY